MFDGISLLKMHFSDLCDNAVVIDSNGIAKESMPGILGKYHYYQSPNGRPVFKHYFGELLYFDSDDRWKVCYTNNHIDIVG